MTRDGEAMTTDSGKTQGPPPTATLTAATDMLQAGTRLSGRYRIVEVIGVGAMGVVYRARDEELDVELALKLLRPTADGQSDSVERFRREILLARQVSHPNVVRIHDIGQDGDIIFLTMDLVGGNTLHERLAEGPLTIDETVRIGAQIADALHAAHDRQVVHRDLKPANILLGDDGRAYVTDFGVARSIDEPSLTVAGRVFGTPDYLSPEQVRGDPLDGRSDLYALGLILCQAMTGRLPFSGETTEETLAQRSVGRVLDPLSLDSRLPRWLGRVIQRCLARDPGDRYPNGAALARDLKRGTAARKWRRRSLQGLAAAGVLLAASVSAWWFWPAPGPMSESGPIERVAVLPLANATAHEELDWVSRTLAETVANALAERPELQVADTMRVLRTLQNLRLSPDQLGSTELRQLAELLDVSRILHGQVSGEPERVQVELVMHSADARPQSRLTTVVPEGGLRAVASEWLDELTGALNSGDIAERELVLPTVDEQASQAYDRGVHHLIRGDSVAAVAPLEQAVENSPDYFLAWSRLAEAYRDSGRHERSLEASSRAIELLPDSRTRQSLWARARHARLIGDTEQASDLLSRLMEAYPNDVEARYALAELEGEMGEFASASILLNQVIERDPNHPRAWFLLGKFAILSGNARQAAEDYLVRALVVQNRVGSEQGRGEVLNAMGIAHEHLGELDLAEDYFHSAAELRESAGDRRGLASTLTNLSRLALINGRYDTARANLQEALDISEALGDTPGMATLFNEFGLLEEEVGNYAASLSNYREALRLRRQLGWDHAIAESENNIAFAYLMLGEYDNAGLFARNALEFYRQHDDVRGEMTALQTLGQLHTARGEWSEAQRLFLSALEISRETDQPFSEAAVEGSLGRLARYQGRFAAALESYDRAIEMLEDLDDVRGVAEFSLWRAELLQHLGQRELAGDTLERTADLINEGGNLSQKAMLASLREAHDRAARLAHESGSPVKQLQMRLAEMRDDPSMTVADAEAAVREAERLGHHLYRLRALDLLATRQLGQGEAEAAMDTARRALRPPSAVEPWAEAWRLHHNMARAAERLGDESLQEAALARMGEEQERVLRGLPAGYADGFRRRIDQEVAHVGQP